MNSSLHDRHQDYATISYVEEHLGALKDSHSSLREQFKALADTHLDQKFLGDLDNNCELKRKQWAKFQKMLRQTQPPSDNIPYDGDDESEKTMKAVVIRNMKNNNMKADVKAQPMSAWVGMKTEDKNTFFWNNTLQ